MSESLKGWASPEEAEALRSQVEKWRAIAEERRLVLEQAAAWFREYEAGHAAKQTPDGDAKAQRNRERAEVCEIALANAVEEESE